ncbi:hypothetical protein [Streptomyces sp. NBC_01497]|uniref:hypothetical protein n=1 Tax=Streptomyces sp. NBC_01497 TaxID=2903885 RepID=UPI002E30699F|nr:hypothetical protein [Streptomyces sp. NBC_01497]
MAVSWDVEAAFVDDDTVVGGASECHQHYLTARHWLVDVEHMDLLDGLSYSPVSGPARAAGSGRWSTIAKDGTVHLWELGQEK